MKIKVSVPATSANIGSGFDALGLAVTLYNTVTFEESDHLDISAADGTRIPRGRDQSVYRSAKGLFDKVGKTMPPLKLVQTNAIPMARGLGSSSACIIAGLLGANRMLGDVLNTQELLTLATSIEGHPDNVAPALLGGLTSSVFEDGVVYSVKRDVDESLCFAAIVPDYKLLTEAARAALPKEVTHKDAVYNLSRAALIPAAFCEGRHDLLAIATEDKLHQPTGCPDARLEGGLRYGAALRRQGGVRLGRRQHRDGCGRKGQRREILLQTGKGPRAAGRFGRM